MQKITWVESKEITSKCLRIKINTGINSFDRRNLAINIERTNLIHTSQLCMKIQIVCPSNWGSQRWEKNQSVLKTNTILVPYWKLIMKRDKAKTLWKHILMSLSHWCVNMLSLSYLYDADEGSCEGGLHEEMWRKPNSRSFY